ncbi:MAG: hypothetical protein ACI92E_001559, partial [Oceanicoccus sp.]
MFNIVIPLSRYPVIPLSRFSVYISSRGRFLCVGMEIEKVAMLMIDA